MSASRGVPCLVFRRYFLSQMSWEAGCSGISATDLSVSLTTSRRTVLMLLDSPFRTDQLPVERTAGGTETPGRRAARAACRSQAGITRPARPLPYAVSCPIRSPLRRLGPVQGVFTLNTIHWGQRCVRPLYLVARQAAKLAPGMRGVNRGRAKPAAADTGLRTRPHGTAESRGSSPVSPSV